MLKIIGAGMAGLLAANMLRHHNPVVIERGPRLPNNHNSVLRFRSTIVGDVLGIDFKKVKMIKAPVEWRNPVADALAYSRKNGGPMRTDRSITDGLVVAERYIAPPDLITRMARDVDIEFDTEYDFKSKDDKVISTVPMPVLVDSMDYPHLSSSDFRWINGGVIRATVLDCEAYCSLMIPDPGTDISRISITGNELIVETPKTPSIVNANGILNQAIGYLGLDKNSIAEVRVSEQRYAKITPIDNDKRLNFIYWASTLKGRAFSLGRFSTWRPGLLLDDLVKDIRRIDGWIKSKSAEYEQEQHHQRQIA
jgi:hypothetical protein